MHYILCGAFKTCGICGISKHNVFELYTMCNTDYVISVMMLGKLTTAYQ